MAVEITAFFIGENMTVPVSDRQSQLYVGNGVNVRFDFMFQVFDQEGETGIAVRLKVDNDFEIMDKSMYVVTTNQDGMGGYITFVDPPSSSTSFYISGNTPVDQLLDITNYDNFYPDAIERAFDKLTAIVQEVMMQISLVWLVLKQEIQDRIDGDLAIRTWVGILLNNIVDSGLVSAIAVTTVESVDDLQHLTKWEGRTIFVKSYWANGKLGGGEFSYHTELNNINDYGHIINGWKRLNTTDYRPVNFGAVPDWNQSTQTGTDSTVFIQRCIDACLNTETNYRNGGKRTITFDPGNYYFVKLNVPRINWFDLTVKGEGMCQFWIKGVGNKDGGIIVNLEGTKWENLVFNGFEGAAGVYPPIFGANDLQYIFQCFLPSPFSLPDIDIVFDGCSTHWGKEFALIRGRGFTFRNGSWGGLQGALCVIDCDPSLIFETSNVSKKNQWFDTGMRHYRIQNNRGDGSQFVVRVQGTAPCKEYIHDIVISDNAIVNNEFGIVYAPDARLIAPKLISNYFTMCNRGFHAKAVVNAVDAGNTWSNNAGTDSTHYDPTVISHGIQNLHIITDSIDGFFAGGIGASYKQIGYSLIYITGANAKVKNVKIKDAFYDDFGDITNATGHLIKFDSIPSEFNNIEIVGNNIKSKNGQMKKWTSHSVSLDYINTENTTDGNFQDHEYVWQKTATVAGIVYNHKYLQEGDYIVGIVVISIDSTVAAGAIGNIQLPVPAIPFNSSLSSQISNVANFGYFNNLKTSKFLSAYITVSSGITLFNVTDAVNLDVSHFTKINASNTSTISISYRYRFKM